MSDRFDALPVSQDDVRKSLASFPALMRDELGKDPHARGGNSNILAWSVRRAAASLRGLSIRPSTQFASICCLAFL